MNSTTIYNTLRKRNETIPIESALYDIWIRRAAYCAYIPSWPLENMQAIGRRLDNNGHWHYIYKLTHNGVTYETE